MTDRKRHKTDYPGIYYRESPDGTKQFIMWYEGTDGRGRFENVPGGLRDAVKARARVVDRIAHGHKMQPSRVRMEEYANLWLDSQINLRPKTLQTYRWAIDKHIVPQMGRCRVSGVDVRRVALFIAQMKKEGYKAWTINNALTPLRLILKRAVREGLVPLDPFPLLEKSERPKADQRKMEILDTAEISVFLTSATDWYRPLLATAIFTGMRRGELLALTWEDIDWENEKIHVRHSKTPAGVRAIVLMPSLAGILKKHKLAQHQGAIYVFETHGGKQMRGDVVLKEAMKKTLERSGIEKSLRLHDLRHTFASILIHQGHDRAFIAKQMGHASPNVTERIYGHLFDEEKKEHEVRSKLEAEFGGML